MKLRPRVLVPVLFIAGLILGAAVTYAGIRLYQQSQTKVPPTTSNNVQAPTPTPTQPVTEPPTSTVAIPQSTTTTIALDVDWRMNATKLTRTQAKNVFATFATDTSLAMRTPDSTSIDSTPPNDEWLDGMWEVGTVSSPAYQGNKLYVVKTGEPFPGGLFESLILVTNGKALFLPTYSPGANNSLDNTRYKGPFGDANYISAPNITIPTLDSQKTVTLANGKTLDRVGDGFPNNGFYMDLSYRFELDAAANSQFKEIGKTGDGKTLYSYTNAVKSGPTNEVGCVLLVLPDGQFVKYASAIPMEVQKSGNVPIITWNKGYGNTQTYNDHIVGGCGGTGCTDIVSDADVGPMSGLTTVGVTKNGDPVYTPVNAAEHKLVLQAYDGWYVPDTKPAINEYLGKHPFPIIFWKDAFGRWVRLTTTDFVPMAECGKPVIYLYPKETTNVSVKLPSSINVTKSEPTYLTNGWNVTAQPNGTLTTADGMSYGSLYWEGTGASYPKPTSGFVIKDGTQNDVLANLLAKYGLNAQESKDFRDFWVPKMTGAPYYRVSFVTSAWSAAAPLHVSPRPHTMIRIFMDWQKLSKNISIPTPTITTPSRNGFTLVEWGGLLIK